MNKTYIRNNFFETNSSSTHAISISTRIIDLDTSLHYFPSTPYAMAPPVVIKTNEFGYDFLKYNNLVDKLSYLWSFLFLITTPRRIQFFDDLPSLIESTGLNLKQANDHIRRIGNLVRRTTGREVIFEKGEEVGVSEHSFDYLPERILNLSDNDLWKWLFDKNSWLYLGNDFQNEKEKTKKEVKKFYIMPKDSIVIATPRGKWED